MSDVIEDSESLIMLGVLAGVAYLGYLLWQKFGAGLTTGASAATNAVSSSIAAGYEALTFGPPIAVAGNLASESGALLGPISSFPAATDSQGNTYLTVNGAVYELGPRNAQGNFTAVPATNVQTAAAGALPASTAGTGSTNWAASAGSTGGTLGTGATY